MRSAWTNLTDSQLLAQCEVDTYRASGPGGQKRNKTSSAVRLRHPPSGLIVIAEESRSQHENRLRALRRLRQALYLKVREEFRPGELSLGSGPPPAPSPTRGGRAGRGVRLRLGRKDPRFWPTAGSVLDALYSSEGRVSEAAAALEITTANLVDFLSTDPKVWEQANHIRARFGQKLLRGS
jgi:RF-1 domain